MSTDIKVSKAQLLKTIQSGEFLGELLGKTAGPLMKVAVPLPKNVLALLVAKASTSAIDGTIQATSRAGVARAGKGVTLVIMNEDMNDIIRILKSLENLGALIVGVSEPAKHDIKKQEIEFLGMLLGTLGASTAGREYNDMDDMDKLFYHLSNIEINMYFNYKTRFNSVFSRDKLPRIKDGAYVKNLDDKESKGTHWISLFY